MRQFTHSINLYKLSKNGKVQVYELSILDDHSDPSFPPSLYTQKGFIDGAKQTDIKEFTEGKNLGRANETTPLQQAVAELNSKVNKLLDKGYKKDPLDGRTPEQFLEDSVGTGALGKKLPMLAQKDTDKIRGYGHAQRKYDGIRSLIDIIAAAIHKSSKRGKPQLNMGHLDKDLLEFNKLYPGDWYLDAELYKHGKSLQKILSLVQRGQSGNKLMGLRVYDLVPMDNLKMQQLDRMKLLKRIRRETKHLEWNIEFVPTIRVKSPKLFAYLRKKWLKEGYEGAMWRSDQGEYEFGVRSYSLIKSKPTEEDEFEIVGVEEATGRDKGTAVFVLKTQDGVVFRARPLGSRAVRRDYLINIKEYIGEMGTVIYRGFTDEGKPKEARFKVVRNYE